MYMANMLFVCIYTSQKESFANLCRIQHTWNLSIKSVEYNYTINNRIFARNIECDIFTRNEIYFILNHIYLINSN